MRQPNRFNREIPFSVHSTTSQFDDGGRRSLPRIIDVCLWLWDVRLRIKIIETTKLSAFSHALNQNLIDCINFAFCCFSPTRQSLSSLFRTHLPTGQWHFQNICKFEKNIGENRRYAYWVMRVWASGRRTNSFGYFVSTEQRTRRWPASRFACIVVPEQNEWHKWHNYSTFILKFNPINISCFSACHLVFLACDKQKSKCVQ